MLKIFRESVSKFVYLEHGVFNLQDNVLRILSFVGLNGLITQRICVWQLVQLQAASMGTRQLNFVFLYVLQTIFQMIKHEHVFKNVHRIMELMEHLVTIQQEFVNKFVLNPMHLQIPKLLIDTVYPNVLKVRVNHLLILLQKLVWVNVLFFQIFLLKLKLLLALQNVFHHILEIQTPIDVN